MRETYYLFLFDDGSLYDMYCAISFEDAIWEMAKYTGVGDELLLKSLRGLKKDDTEGMIQLYNKFAYTKVIKVYEVKRVVYDEKKGNK